MCFAILLPRPFTGCKTAAAIFGKGDFRPALLKMICMPWRSSGTGKKFLAEIKNNHYQTEEGVAHEIV